VKEILNEYAETKEERNNKEREEGTMSKETNERRK
jgi:hypothetical protein